MQFKEDRTFVFITSHQIDEEWQQQQSKICQLQCRTETPSFLSPLLRNDTINYSNFNRRLQRTGSNCDVRWTRPWLQIRIQLQSDSSWRLQSLSTSNLQTLPSLPSQTCVRNECDYGLSESWCNEGRQDDFELLSSYIQKLEPAKRGSVASCFSHTLNVHKRYAVSLSPVIRKCRMY